jgi:hypothetical protein
MPYLWLQCTLMDAMDYERFFALPQSARAWLVSAKLELSSDHLGLKL